MPTVEPFGPRMIERYLESNDLAYSTDDRGGYIFGYDHDEECGCTLSVWLVIDEDEPGEYSVQVESDRRFSVSDWERCVWLCNAWNRENRYPTAFLDVGEPGAEAASAFPVAHIHMGAPGVDLAAEIRLEQNFDLEAGIHQELFDDLTNSAIDGAFEFWRWAHRERGL